MSTVLPAVLWACIEAWIVSARAPIPASTISMFRNWLMSTLSRTISALIGVGSKAMTRPPGPAAWSCPRGGVGAVAGTRPSPIFAYGSVCETEPEEEDDDDRRQNGADRVNREGGTAISSGICWPSPPNGYWNWRSRRTPAPGTAADLPLAPITATATESDRGRRGPVGSTWRSRSSAREPTCRASLSRAAPPRRPWSR